MFLAFDRHARRRGGTPDGLSQTNGSLCGEANRLKREPIAASCQPSFAGQGHIVRCAKVRERQFARRDG